MLYYDAAQFRREGVPPVDSNWDWDALVANAAKLTKRRADGAVGALGAGDTQQWALVGALAERSGRGRSGHVAVPVAGAGGD